MKTTGNGPSHSERPTPTPGCRPHWLQNPSAKTRRRPLLAPAAGTPDGGDPSPGAPPALVSIAANSEGQEPLMVTLQVSFACVAIAAEATPNF